MSPRSGLAGVATAGLLVVGLAACSSSSTATDQAAPQTTSAGSSSSTTSATPSSTTASAAASTTSTDGNPGVQALLDTARSSALGAKSGHAKGSFVIDGQNSVIEVAGTMDGANESGALAQGSLQVEYLVVSGTAYLRGNKDFWTKAGATASRAATLEAAHKWVKAPLSEVKQLTDNSTFPALVTKIFDETKGANSLNTKTEDKTVDGVDCYSFSDRFGADDASFAVAKSTGLPVHLSAGTTADMAFDQWNSAGAVAAPPASEILN